eukprot:TRINITY_DN8836_c1_g1_i1.p1 TRINITY_DN8836_c1_g1~~TRINITY_DN8836_c1_g1_i1.p1  ORF type:complete len:630 (+),score=105.43 TRINITY_DN8836_c1_g1_i1:201-2090(+)
MATVSFPCKLSLLISSSYYRQSRRASHFCSSESLRLCSARSISTTLRSSEADVKHEEMKERNVALGFGEDDEDESISKIPVPRQRYISVSKTALVRELVSLFREERDAEQFLTICSIVFAIRFQQNFMKLLRNAEFQELSVQDLQLSSALNSDYLLTLPIDVDWKGASSSNAIIFRRGYTTEKQEGLLLGEKFDYLQSRILQNLFGSLSQPVISLVLWINQKLEKLGTSTHIKSWFKAVEHWLKEPLQQDDIKHSRNMRQAEKWYQESNLLLSNRKSDMPISLAAKEAIPRYEKFLSSAGSRGRLLRKFLVWIGLLPNEMSMSILNVNGISSSDPYVSTNFLTRVSLRDIWKPATKEACEYNIWRQLKAVSSVIFSRSVLQEPAFKELVLLYTGPMDEETNAKDNKVPNLQLKIYNKIPLPDLKVVFPNKKLSFRILDTVRLDIATILGLLAFFINYKFEDIFVSLSAFILDLVAAGALIVFLTRAVLGYKQTWDRYQLLVNRTLYEKTLSSGYGTVHYLVDASEQQQLKEAILVYAILLQQKETQMHGQQQIASLCEKFVFNKFNEKIEMPVNKALETLMRLGLVTQDITMKNAEKKESSPIYSLKVVPYVKAYKSLEKRWSSLLYQE